MTSSDFQGSIEIPMNFELSMPEFQGSFKFIMLWGEVPDARLDNQMFVSHGTPAV